MRHIVPISGKDSLATAFVAAARQELPYEYFFTDTETELPETYAWLKMVEEKTGWKILRIGVSLIDRINRRSGYLPSRLARYCTKEGKIEPMEKLLGKNECTVYYGLRADEVRTGYIPIGKPNITPAYPLRDLNIDLQGVYAILDAQGLTPPNFFWRRLYEAVSERLLDCSGWEERLTRIEFGILFAGRSRGNCWFCFFQRLYEFVWLLETHPELFEQAERMEKAEYSFKEDLPLRELRQPAQAKQIFERRVKVVVKAIAAKFQGRLFPEAADNEIALTSCGLLCGK